MKLRFYARGDLMPLVPGYVPAVGGIPRRIGRAHVVVDGVATHPATKEGFELDSADPRAARVSKMARREEIWCADAETAAAVGAQFVPVKFADGEWVPDVKTAAKAKE